jgi:hypothetical protein
MAEVKEAQKKGGREKTEAGVAPVARCASKGGRSLEKQST